MVVDQKRKENSYAKLATKQFDAHKQHSSPLNGSDNESTHLHACFDIGILLQYILHQTIRDSESVFTSTHAQISMGNSFFLLKIR